jgi:hypothetical protein
MLNAPFTIETVYRTSIWFDYGPDGDIDLDDAILNLKYGDLEVSICPMSPASFPYVTVEGSDWGKVKQHAVKVVRLIRSKGGKINP